MKLVKLTNGVSFGTKLTVTADDLDSDGKLTVKFVGASENEPSYDLAVVVNAFNASNAPVTLTTVEVAKSTVTIDGLSATDVVHIIAQRSADGEDVVLA